MTENINIDKLSIQLQEIESMKYILGIKNQELSHENLKSQIDNLCKDNFAFLIVLNSYLSEIPKQVKQVIDKIINSKDDEEKCKKLYEEYLNQYQTNQTFKEYQNYIYTQRSQDVILNIENTDKGNYKKLENKLIKNKSIQLALLFNILFDMQGFLLGGEPNEVSNKLLCLPFVPIDFVENLPQLIMWVNNNSEKPIEPLTDDECKIIAALMAGYNDKDYADADNIIQNLPVKFGVQNITQVMFRIYLLKPHIWNNTDYYDLVNSIKNVRELVSIK